MVSVETMIIRFGLVWKGLFLVDDECTAQQRCNLSSIAWEVEGDADAREINNVTSDFIFRLVVLLWVPLVKFGLKPLWGFCAKTDYRPYAIFGGERVALLRY